MRARWCQDGGDRRRSEHGMSVLHGDMDTGHVGMTHMGTHGHGTRTWAWTHRHTDADPAHTGTHRHETLGYRRGGTVRVGGCTHRGTRGPGHMDLVQVMDAVSACTQTGTHRDTWGQWHCAQTDGPTCWHTGRDAAQLCTDRQTHTRPRQRRGSGWHSQDGGSGGAQ